MTWVLRIACDVPVTVAMDGLFDYAPRELHCGDGTVLGLNQPEAWIGRAVLVPFGRAAKSKEAPLVVGWVFDVAEHSDVPIDKLKSVIAVVPCVPRADASWLQLMRFMARYYQRGLGEVSLPALPNKLRTARNFAPDASGTWQLQSGKRVWQSWQKTWHSAAQRPAALEPSNHLQLTPTQQTVLDNLLRARSEPLTQHHAPQLLFGVTGSGKTEVYLQYLAQILSEDDTAQVLILVPEINLTPQFFQRLTARFGAETVVSLHSGLNDGERLLAWWRAAHGHARVVLGTRLSILAMLPQLKAIVVDEEHDASYRQQDGVRYSARDVAIYRANQLNIPIILGSATPSFETWANAQSGRYGLHSLRERAVSGARLPKVHLLNTAQLPVQEGLSAPLAEAIDGALSRGQMSLLFQNRRGYAPVVYCTYCGWMADCTACSAHMVYHKNTRHLHCHHCGVHRAIPKQCPTCGNSDIVPLGQGTQRLEEILQARWPQARVLRLDADSTRAKGALETHLSKIAEGEIDIVVGTQILAKGHDWANLTVVGVLDVDGGLFAQDYRAPERLFAQLQQVIGRAGRGQAAGEVLIQSRFVEHGMWAHLLAHDFERFAQEELMVREQLALPPFGSNALFQVGADAYKDALAFAQTARELALAIITEQPQFASITINAAVPMHMMRVKHSERAQVLIECASRARLQAFLPLWQQAIVAQKSRLTWLIEVDPADI
ncbi:MAG: primosomal protein N' [Hydromonas sp.]|jgi:primosomal protein N' (replication factor Y)|nr:primosomal protein N' [Hydromonas sp.]